MTYKYHLITSGFDDGSQIRELNTESIEPLASRLIEGDIVTATSDVGSVFNRSPLALLAAAGQFEGSYTFDSDTILALGGIVPDTEYASGYRARGTLPNGALTTWLDLTWFIPTGAEETAAVEEADAVPA